MRTCILVLIFLHCSTYLWSQKPPIQFSDLDTWPDVSSGAEISPDGQYILYSIGNGTLKTTTLVLKASNLDWEKQIPNGMNPHITWDSRQVIFTLPGDSLGFFELGTDRIDFITGVKNYKVSKEKTGIWIAYLETDNQHTLILKNKLTNREKQFRHVNYYAFSDYGAALILREADTVKEGVRQSIVYVDLSDGSDRTVWKNKPVDSIKIDDPILNSKGTQTAFCVRETQNGRINTSIYCYRQPNEQAFRIYNDSTLQYTDQLRVQNISHFSKKNDLLFITMTEIEGSACIRTDMANVDIWNYQDYKLQSEQLNEVSEKNGYLARIDLLNGQFLQLTKKNESGQSFDSAIDDKYIIVRVKKHDINEDEASWYPKYEVAIYLENVYTGERKLFEHGRSGMYDGTMSPSGKYFVYFDGNKHTYCSCDLISGVTHAITNGIPVGWSYSENEIPNISRGGHGIAGWLSDGESVLIYDQWDIWLIDLTGEKAAINITNGYGRQHSIQFRLPIQTHVNILNRIDTLILSAFNKRTKENGFYLKEGLKPGNPKLLTFGNYFFGKNFHGDAFLKAKNIRVYVVQRESCTEFPNYFITKDFKSFFAISQLEPQKGFNWMTSRLVNWKTFDSADCQGILYVPEDFNPANKYPLIVHYYEKRSDELNQYIFPTLASGDINIPWFVSNGYIVFVPDIHYKMGYPGASAYNCIVSGAEMLARNRWIDKQRMGLQGHSFGGYETNYVITHSKMFAAAMSASAVCDLINQYLSLWHNGLGQEGFVEMGQIRMKFNLWQNKKLYILNSPVFNADQVNTPLLMMNNKGDNVVSFSQGAEFYLALRRLGKKVWMLQYDGEGHSIDSPKAEVDYTKRMTEFFDYFLKNRAEPQWMRVGIPAADKGCMDGL